MALKREKEAVMNKTRNLGFNDQHKVARLTKSLLGPMLGLTIALTPVSGAHVAAATSALANRELPILSAGGRQAATDLRAGVWCSETKPSKGSATLSWKVSNSGQQRVDFTMYRDGFERGMFETIGPLPVDQSSVEIDGLEPGINYYWRVLTLTPKGWVPSETARCEGIGCPPAGGQ
jgi:hypothetical protein